jgi:hypothetical protein
VSWELRTLHFRTRRSTWLVLALGILASNGSSKGGRVLIGKYNSMNEEERERFNDMATDGWSTAPF